MILRALLAALSCVAASVAIPDPAAPPQYFTVAKNGHVELTLRGFSKSGLKRKAYITSLPAKGHLYQLSQPYQKQGREPKYVASGKITFASPQSPVEVTSKKNKLIYVPPADEAEPGGEWARFTYKTRATTTGVWSPFGHVLILPESKELVSSAFSLGADNWAIRGGSSQADIFYEASRSGRMNNFVYHTDDAIDVRSSTSDHKRWKFCAPIKYLTNFELAYKGTLEFTLRSFSGDFSKLNEKRDSVILQCSTCNQGRGMVFVQRDLAFPDGHEKHFSIELSETTGWLMDPKNTNVAWQAPSDCQMVEMLSSLSERVAPRCVLSNTALAPSVADACALCARSYRLCILGDHTKWYESVGLDNVAIKAGPSSSIPLECSCANPGTQCTS